MFDYRCNQPVTTCLLCENCRRPPLRRTPVNNSTSRRATLAERSKSGACGTLGRDLAGATRGGRPDAGLLLPVVLYMTDCCICSGSAAGLPPQVARRECGQTALVLPP